MSSPKLSTTPYLSDDKVSDGRIEKDSDQVLDTSKFKKTNRPIRSCSRCKKRKVKCNFEIPCDRCIARNQAHLCTRDPVIFDGLLITNDNTQELKYSQENEALKKKIKELQKTIVKLKTINSDDDGNIPNISHHNNSDNSNDNNSIIDESTSTIVPSYDRIKLNETFLTDKKKTKSKRNKTSKSEGHIDWNSYSSIISVLEKALTNGLILDNSNQSPNEMDYNSEEWLLLNDKTYLQYTGEDIKSKCAMYELDLLNKLDKQKCDILVKAGLRINILFPIIDAKQFLENYERYWANDKFPVKHITPYYTKSASSYSLLSLMYALMCFGLYQCDEEDTKNLNFTYYDWDNFSRGLFSSALESLYRARYMTHPEIATLQIISIIRILAGFLGGINLSSCLTGTSFFISYKLNLIRTNDFIKLNNMWLTLSYDWYDDRDRYSLTTLAYADSLKKLERFVDNGNEKEELVNWSQYLLMRNVEVSIIRKKYYFGGVNLSLKNLKSADLELSCLKAEIHRDIDSYTPEKYPEITVETIECIKFHLDGFINNEILEINLKMSTFMSYKEWSSLCYQNCKTCSTKILEQFISNTVLLIFKSYPYVFEHVIYSIVFLIVDCMLDDQHMKNQNHIITLAQKIIPMFKSFKPLIRGAIRGVYVIEKLLTVMKFKRTKNSDNTINETNTSVKNISDSLSEYNSNGKNQEESELYDSDNESKVGVNPLYYSKLSIKINDNKAEHELQNANILKNNKITKKSNKDVSNLPFVMLNNVPQTSMKFPSNFSQISLPKIIIDILEDSGWSQFINYIDEFDE
ncbi:hypothetical protein C6P42_000765 [Pichia californica]|nr:hypothetical protein C6P42_000765 [[Candida] californica]